MTGSSVVEEVSVTMMGDVDDVGTSEVLEVGTSEVVEDETSEVEV